MTIKDFIKAIQTGNLEQVKGILSKNEGFLNEKYGYLQYTPILWAVYYNKFDIFNFLLESGADLYHSKSKNKANLLHFLLPYYNKKHIAEILDKIIKNHSFGKVEIKYAEDFCNDVLAKKEYRLTEIIKNLLYSGKIPPNLTNKKPGNDGFVGREKELNEVNDLMKRNDSLLLINGIGGIGKSSLAKEYLKRHYKNYNYYGFVEVSGSIKESFISEFNNSLHLRKEKIDEAFNEAIYKLHNLEGRKLLIIDNVNNLETQKEEIKLINNLKNSNFKIIFTSREEIGSIEIYYLDKLNKEDAKKLFNSIYEIKDEELLIQILEYLDYHALFIKKVATTLKNKSSLTPEKIIEKFKNGEFTQINVKRKESFNDLLNELFSIDNLEEEEILTLKKFSILPAIEISFDNLQLIFIKNEEELEDFEDLLNYLSEKGWLIKVNHSFKLHQIIKEYLLKNHTAEFEEIKEQFDYFANIIEDSTNVMLAVKIKEILDFYDSISNFLLKVINIENKETAYFYGNLGNIYRSLSNYSKAKILLKKTLEITEEVLGEKHPDTATSYNNLAGLYEKIGDYEKALQYVMKAYQIYKKILPENHPWLLNAQMGLEIIIKKLNN